MTTKNMPTCPHCNKPLPMDKIVLHPRDLLILCVVCLAAGGFLRMLLTWMQIGGY